MLNYDRYLNADNSLLLREYTRVAGELGTALQELSTARVSYESGYVRTMLGTEGSVAEKERVARGAVLHIRTAILEVEASVEILTREQALIDYLRTANAERQSPVDCGQ